MAIVAYTDTIAFRNCAALQEDMPAGSHGLAGVVQQVQQHGFHQIRFHFRHAGLNTYLQVDTCLFQCWAQHIGDPLQKGTHLRPARGDTALLQYEDVQKFMGQTLQTAPLPKDAGGALRTS